MGNCVKSPLRNLSKKVCSLNQSAFPALLLGMGDVVGRWEREVGETQGGVRRVQLSSPAFFVRAAHASAAVTARDTGCHSMCVNKRVCAHTHGSACVLQRVCVQLSSGYVQGCACRCAQHAGTHFLYEHLTVRVCV